MRRSFPATDLARDEAAERRSRAAAGAVAKAG
ncbi:hypothetical protein BH20ACT2_BH20ACT2_10650 [soil metagenome]